MRPKSGLPKRRALRRMPAFEFGFRENPKVRPYAHPEIAGKEHVPAPYSVVSFFSGCGGLDLGAYGGFTFLGNYYPVQNINIIAAYDNDEKAIATYRLNLSDNAQVLDLCEADISELPKADILLGGFPCQDFSSCGHKMGFSGPRGLLYQRMVEYMRAHQPKIVIGENVPLLKGMKQGALLQKIKADLQAVGYNVKHWFINCPDYGLPASRRRIFIICVRNDVHGFPTMPEPTHLLSFVSIDDAIGDLIDVHDETVANQSQYFVATRATAGAGQGDQTSKKGELGYAVRANAKARIHFHYELDRRLTVRELARLQSFPDEFVFPFAAGPNVMQIGNAVPPIVGHAVMSSIVGFLDSVRTFAGKSTASIAA
jgi:DNA (cytosine-5)-methyltransferase 1